MDTEALHLVLQQSFSPDANLRGPAEATIRNLKHVDGASVMLLQVAGEKQVSDVILIYRNSLQLSMSHKIITEKTGSVRSAPGGCHSAQESVSRMLG